MTAVEHVGGDAVRLAAAALRFFATPDPDDPTRMTYWRRNRDGGLRSWPNRVTHLPFPGRVDTPAELYEPTRRRELRQFRRDWFAANRDRLWGWWERVHAAVGADPGGCAARFAALRTACCVCGRPLADPTSRAYAVHPACSQGWPQPVLDELAAAVRVAVGVGL